MKKSLFFIVMAIVLGVFIVLMREEDPNFEIIFTNELEELHTSKLCLKNENGKLEIIEFEHPKVNDIEKYIISLYNERRNSLPLNYVTPVREIFKVRHFERNNDELNISLEEVSGNIKELMTSLMWTYQEIGIKTINFTINGLYYKYHENCDINVVYELISPNTYVKQTILYIDGSIIFPVTYYHKNDEIDFLLNKIFYKYGITNIDYQYISDDDYLYLYINDPDYNMNENIIDLIYTNIINLLNNNNVSIIKNGIVVK